MKKRLENYKIAVWVLSAVIFIQFIVIFILLAPKKPLGPKPPVVIPAAIKGKIAIVLDDWGYNLNNLGLLEGIRYPLTMSVLPNLPYSHSLAATFNDSGYEVILHLPMQPHGNPKLEKDTIMASADEAAVKRIVSRDLASVAYAKGVSNHMGSSATESRAVMQSLLKELKSRKLYFLDSLASSKSLGKELAEKLGVNFSSRDIFLDNKEFPDYIRQQLYKLKVKARAGGYAIGIGHDRKVTLEVLKEMVPLMAKEGYRFVFVSELVK